MELIFKTNNNNNKNNKKKDEMKERMYQEKNERNQKYTNKESRVKEWSTRELMLNVHKETVAKKDPKMKKWVENEERKMKGLLPNTQRTSRHVVKFNNFQKLQT